MSLLLGTHYRLAYDQVTRNRGRSFLTGLGISIGVASIILILSLMGSIKNLVSTQVETAGMSLIVVRPSTNQNAVDSIITDLTTQNQYLTSNLSMNDVKTIKGIEGISAVAPLASTVTTLTTDRTDDAGKPYLHTIDSASLVGTTKDFEVIENLTLKAGTFLSESDKSNTAAIGRDLSLRLFGTQESIGRTFTAFGTKFFITGLLKTESEPVNYNNIDFDNTVFVNADFLSSLGTPIQIQQISARAKTTDLLPSLSEAIKTKLTETKKGDKNFTVAYGDNISHPASNFFNLISGMLTIVAGISLIVGGVGIMNIMLVSVAERTREIGIRKSVGATSGNILLQFLFESLILSTLGGVGGLALGYILAFLLSVITPFNPYIDINILMITLATSVAIGLIFGIYPAVKAARKNPIDSLRYYR
ncbi:ABC transporter permease [Candidatus Saccharibacteria bacterium]|nr:ABC transporter permease [Candidatus Saccharibacteria bacterium]